MGCCDGLVCVALQSSMFLWNPATQESRKIPYPGSFAEYQTALAFGYVSSIDDYKLVSDCYDFDLPNTKSQTLALKDGKWGDVILYDESEYYIQLCQLPTVIDSL